MARCSGLLVLAALSALATLSAATGLGIRSPASQPPASTYQLPPGVEVHALVFYGRRATFKLLNCALPAAWAPRTAAGQPAPK